MQWSTEIIRRYILRQEWRNRLQFSDDRPPFRKFYIEYTMKTSKKDSKSKTLDFIELKESTDWWNELND